MTRIRTGLVIGGGIAGPVAAMALRRAGIDATLYEAHHDTAEGIGGGLSIAPNGLDALDAVRAADAVRRIGDPMTAIVLESWTGRRLAEFGTPPDLPPMLFAWRSDLYRALHQEVTHQGIPTVYGRRLIDADDTGTGVTARFADGTSAEGDVLIGADGIRSTVRTLIDPASPHPRYTGLLGFGGRTRHTGLPATDGRMHMIFGKRAFFGYGVADDSSCGWFANLPRAAPLTLAQARDIGPRRWLRLLDEAFARDRGPALDVVRGTDPADLVIVGALEDLPTIPRWSRGRMVLVGDAAHATSPSSGQGASLAAESAVQLARCLRDLPYPEAFGVYERLRRTRVERLIAMAARTNSDKAAGPVARVLRDLLLPLAMRFARPEKYAWQFRHRIDWDARVCPASDPATTNR
jgi:2-polyprenyl-6-methoxyphenol hydroxylase-like FAD-dependent oxidoreductase